MATTTKDIAKRCRPQAAITVAKKSNPNEPGLLKQIRALAAGVTFLNETRVAIPRGATEQALRKAEYMSWIR
jgi:hypothetical protein